MVVWSDCFTGHSDNKSTYGTSLSVLELLQSKILAGVLETTIGMRTSYIWAPSFGNRLLLFLNINSVPFFHIKCQPAMQAAVVEHSILSLSSPSRGCGTHVN